LTIDGGKANLLGVYRKFFLPTYGVFDEERFVSSGRDLCVLDSRFGRLAILICEDVWHSILPTLCAVRGAQLLLVPAASPARGFSGSDIENHERYRRLFQGISEEHGLYCLNSQLCGFEGGKGFIGGSMIIDPLGNVQVQAVLGEESLLVADIDLDLISIARANSPLLTDLRSAWGDIRRLVDGS
jgi:predicted amidohydrolase